MEFLIQLHYVYNKSILKWGLQLGGPLWTTTPPWWLHSLPGQPSSQISASKISVNKRAPQMEPKGSQREARECSSRGFVRLWLHFSFHFGFFLGALGLLKNSCNCVWLFIIFKASAPSRRGSFARLFLGPLLLAFFLLLGTSLHHFGDPVLEKVWK